MIELKRKDNSITTDYCRVGKFQIQKFSAFARKVKTKLQETILPTPLFTYKMEIIIKSLFRAAARIKQINWARRGT